MIWLRRRKGSNCGFVFVIFIILLIVNKPLAEAAHGERAILKNFKEKT